MYLSPYLIEEKKDFPIFSLVFLNQKDGDLLFKRCDCIMMPTFDAVIIPYRIIKSLKLQKSYIEKAYLFFAKEIVITEIFYLNLIVCVKDLRKFYKHKKILSVPPLTIFGFLQENYPRYIPIFYEVAHKATKEKTQSLLNILKKKDPYEAFLEISQKYFNFWEILKEREYEFFKEIEKFCLSFKYGYVGKEILDDFLIILNGKDKLLMIDDDELALRHESGFLYEKDPKTITTFARLRHYQGYLGEAQRLYDKIMEIDKTDRGKSIVLRNKALVYFDQSDYITAKHFLQESINYAKRASDSFGEGLSYAHLARCLQMLGHYQEALDAINKASTLLKDTPYMEILEQYKENINWDKALYERKSKPQYQETCG